MSSSWKKKAMGTEKIDDYSKNVDHRSEEEKAIDAWLPITSSRNAKWWYSAFHNVTAMVGAGVLSLPYAMSELGWGPGVAVMVISWIVTLYTLWQMVEMHEMVPGKRFDRYHELGQHAFGEKLGLYIVVPQQLFYNDLCFCPLCPLSSSQLQLDFWCFVGCSSHVLEVCISDVQYGYKATTTAGTVFNFFSALGDVAFAYAGHNVVLEIQATIPSTPEKPSKGPMWRGVIVAYIVVALCYFPVAFIGYIKSERS